MFFTFVPAFRPFAALARFFTPRYPVYYPPRWACCERWICEAPARSTEEAKKLIETSKVEEVPQELVNAKILKKDYGITTFVTIKSPSNNSNLYVDGELVAPTDYRYARLVNESSESSGSLDTLRAHIDRAIRKTKKWNHRWHPSKCHYNDYYLSSSLQPYCFCSECSPDCQTRYELHKARALVDYLEQEAKEVEREATGT